MTKRKSTDQAGGHHPCAEDGGSMILFDIQIATGAARRGSGDDIGRGRRGGGGPRMRINRCEQSRRRDGAAEPTVQI
jgi:hypothetical protein